MDKYQEPFTEFEKACGEFKDAIIADLKPFLVPILDFLLDHLLFAKVIVFIVFVVGIYFIILC